MEVLRYSEWGSTAKTIQLVSQMLGKFKLGQMPPQPEWLHVTLPLTARGFTTGLVPYGDFGCTVDIDLFDSSVTARCTNGKESSFSLLEADTIAARYSSFISMLADVGVEIEINPMPQEMSIKTPFDQDFEARPYDAAYAVKGFEMFVFAHSAILNFVSSFRNKKSKPALFWGTFDLTGVLFSGKPVPYQGEGIIEKVAFDEELIEYGFWPGDDTLEDPSFFVMPYPFLTQDMSHTLSEGSIGFYSAEQSEYFLPLAKLLASEDPHGELMRFFNETFTALSEVGHWEDREWYTEPLLVK